MADPRFTKGDRVRGPQYSYCPEFIRVGIVTEVIPDRKAAGEWFYRVQTQESGYFVWAENDLTLLPPAGPHEWPNATDPRYA